MRKILQEAKLRGVAPILCTPVPRKFWMGKKLERDIHTPWIHTIAAAEGVPVVELNEIAASMYEQMEPHEVDGMFAGDNVHTMLPGAQINAACVVKGLQALPRNPLAAYLGG